MLNIPNLDIHALRLTIRNLCASIFPHGLKAQCKTADLNSRAGQVLFLGLISV